MKKVDSHFLVIAVPGVQVTDGDQPLYFAAVIHDRKMANAMLTENAAGVIDRRLPVVDDSGKVQGLISIGDLNAWHSNHQEVTIHFLNEYMLGRT